MSVTKTKIGTILDAKTVCSLKQAAKKQGRPVSEIIDRAIIEYLQEKPAEEDRRRNTLRLLENTTKLSKKGFRQILELDPYDQ